MKPSEMKTVQGARDIINGHNLTHVKVGVVDMKGIVRGKYLSKESFFLSWTAGMKDTGQGSSMSVIGFHSLVHSDLYHFKE